MTEKQQRILTTALELFAQEGFDITSTSKIAKQAAVSEGLIFRHFTNKKGLLLALTSEMKAKMEALFQPIIAESDPRQCIRQTLALPFSIAKTEYDYWRLQYKLKWEKDYQQDGKLQPLQDRLTAAFEELGYANPQQEALLLIQILDAIAIALLRDEIPNRQAYLAFLLEKYQC